jgi:predicted ATPase
MQINRIKIKNFKSLKNVDVRLNNLTLITGVNSSGKSSFIQSLIEILILPSSATSSNIMSSLKVFWLNNNASSSCLPIWQNRAGHCVTEKR